VKKVWLVAVVAAGIIVLGIIAAAGGAQDAYARGLAEGQADMRAQMQPEMKKQFQLGQKAGVEYEDWFCANPKVAASLGQDGK
jgi:hypothetical protein